LKFSIEIRQDVWRNRRKDADSEATANVVFQLVYATARISDLDQNFFRVLEQALTRFSHDYGAREAIEQPLTEFRFQFLNLLTERRLGDVFASSRARETAFFSDGDENSGVDEFPFWDDLANTLLAAVILSTRAG
jgi:hypothetical protein